MIRTTISKLRHVCALAYFVPRLLKGNIRYIPGRFEKLSVSVQRSVDKSTDSRSEEDSYYERCQRIIDHAFSPNPPYTYYTPDKHTETKRGFLNLMTQKEPIGPESQCEKCQRIIDQIFGGDSNSGDKKRDTVDPVCIPMTELQATTVKENEEVLAQKVEFIDETPLVEAAVKSKLEGFNLQPKVLGKRRKRQTNKRFPILNFSADKGRKRGASKKDNTFDELAKRCLDSPSGQIDERILKEMEKLGVPPSTRKGSKRTAGDSGIIQPEIMKRPRRPVEKTEIDFLSRMRRLMQSERLNENLPPPFELIPVKNYAVLSPNLEVEDNTLYVERMQPYHLTDQINCSSEDTEEYAGPNVGHKDENPPQQLGQMTAAVISNETNILSDETHMVANKTDMITDNSDEFEHLIVKQERIRNINDIHSNLSDHGTTNHEPPAVRPGVVIKNSTDDDVSCLKQMEKESMDISREKIATTNLLSNMVDPNEISPQAEPAGFMKEYTEIEILRNLLQSRFEHLTNDTVKSRQFQEFTTELSEDSAPTVETETDYHQEIELLKVERINPYYLKEDSNIISKETSPHTEPCIPNKEITGSTATQAMDDKNAIHRGYSPNQKLITSYQLFEQISLMSRETELGATDDYQEIEHTKPEPGQLLEKVGILCKDIPSPEKTCVLPDYNTPAEMGRIDSAVNEERLTDPNLLIPSSKIENGKEQLTDANLAVATLNREPILQEAVDSSSAAQGTLINPLLDKSTVAHVAAENMQTDTSSDTIPKEHPPKPLTLSEMLKRVRERNLMELCKGIVEMKVQNAQADPVVGKCGNKNPPCPPPAPTCPPPTCPPPPKPKPPCPKPCKPKCPPTCPPTPCGKSKTECPPVKKSPCEKFTKTKCSNIEIQDALTLLLYLGPQFHIPRYSMLPIVACAHNLNNNIVEQMCTKLQELSNIILNTTITGGLNAFESVLVGNDNTHYARTYDPWSPIPSWPIPVKEGKKKFVCPKEGCKVIPPKLNDPCPNINPCKHLPRHDKFAVIDYIFNKLGKKVVSDV